MTGIAIGSLIVAVFALAWTIYRDIATRFDLKDETAERKDQLAREEGRREEELRLLRLQVARQLTSEHDSQTADLIGKSTGYSGSSRGVTFPMSVRNAGAAVARDVKVWLALATDDPSPAAAPHLTAPHDLGDLARNDQPAGFALEQTGVLAGGGVPRDGLVVASWRDGDGERVDTIGKLTVFL